MNHKAATGSNAYVQDDPSANALATLIKGTRRLLNSLKQILKKALAYLPLAETTHVRDAISTASVFGLPYCPPNEGDFIYAMIRAHEFSRCLETGFHTGSTALYMLAASENVGGTVTSICVDDDMTVKRGQDLIESHGYEDRHTLIRSNSAHSLASMMTTESTLDFVYIDGWKTFDHLAFEVYAINQMLVVGGIILFDDADMPSVRRVIRLLRCYYKYVPVDFSVYGQHWRSRLLDRLTRTTVHDPFFALQKTNEPAKQPAFNDWHFDHRL